MDDGILNYKGHWMWFEKPWGIVSGFMWREAVNG